jgi:hypothetical protein
VFTRGPFHSPGWGPLFDRNFLDIVVSLDDEVENLNHKPDGEAHLLYIHLFDSFSENHLVDNQQVGCHGSLFFCWLLM